MVAREKLKRSVGGGNYFASPKIDYEFTSTGCKLLDLALGGGWAESRCCNIIGDSSCLPGETIVSALRGARPKKMDISTLYKRVKGHHHNRNKELETYLVADVGDYVGTVKMLDIFEAGNKYLYKVTDVQGHSIEASEEHQFLTDEGWHRLADLRVGGHIRKWRSARGVSEGKRVAARRAQVYSIPFHPFGYKNVVAGRDYKRLPKARLVVEAAINGLDLDELIRILRHEPIMSASLQYVEPPLQIHHLNGNPLDDSLDNLQIMEPEDHWRLHADELPVNAMPLDWAAIRSITKKCKRLVYDIAMDAPYHNFVANGFVVHNSGKTLLAIEAANNFARKHKGRQRNIFFREPEHAFDLPYAEALGLPLDRVDLERPRTVEALFKDLAVVCTKHKGKQPALYIVDSLDSLSDEAELELDIGEGTYGTGKAKAMSQLFRRLIGEVEESRITLMIISQIRDKIGALPFQKKWVRGGGRALDFYTSQILVLKVANPVVRTIHGFKRTVGIEVHAKVEKNKIRSPSRDADFQIHFGYGIYDLQASLEWLKAGKLLGDVGLTEASMKTLLAKAPAMGWDEYEKTLARINAAVEKRWYEIEAATISSRPKYRNEADQ